MYPSTNDEDITIESNQAGNETAAIMAGGLSLPFFILTIKHIELKNLFNKVADDIWAARAGFVLGLFLLLVCAITLVMKSQKRLVVDRKRRMLRLHIKNRFQNQLQIYKFDEIRGVKIRTAGNGKSGPPIYHLDLILTSGQRLKLGRWSFSAQEIETEAENLAAALGVSLNPTYLPLGDLNPQSLAIALIGSVIGYAIYYRISIGPWCSGMWHGTAPPVIIIILFINILLLTRLRKVGK